MQREVPGLPMRSRVLPCGRRSATGSEAAGALAGFGACRGRCAHAPRRSERENSSGSRGFPPDAPARRGVAEDPAPGPWSSRGTLGPASHPFSPRSEMKVADIDASGSWRIDDEPFNRGSGDVDCREWINTGVCGRRSLFVALGIRMNIAGSSGREFCGGFSPEHRDGSMTSRCYLSPRSPF